MFRKYNADLRAGLVVFLVALPLCLGIALAQKAPLFSGIISGIIGGIVVALISRSRLSVSGPAAGISGIVLSGMEELGSFEVFLLALCIAGVIQLLLGILKAGIIGYYFPSAIIKGMLAAIGIILIIKQVPHLVGYDADTEGDFSFIQTDGHNSLSELGYMLNYLSPGSVIIGLVSLFIMFAWDSKLIKGKKFMSFLPAALIVVVSGVLINEFLIAYNPEIDVKAEHLVSLPHIRSLADLSDSIIFPDFTAFTNPKVYSVAFTLAIVASLATLLCVEAVDKLDPENEITPTNRELIAQGVGNLLCGLLGGVPISSVIVRSSANLDAGAQSRMSSVFHGVFFVICILFIPSVLEKIPYSALAGVLIHTGYKLCHPRIIRNVFKAGWDQFLPFAITIAVMLLTDLLKGVCIGIVVSIIFILRQNYRNPYKFISDSIDGVPHYFIKLSQNVTFLNKGKMVETLHQIPHGAKVYIDGGSAHFIDKDVLEVISEFKRAATRHNIEVVLENIEEVELISTN